MLLHNAATQLLNNTGPISPSLWQGCLVALHYDDCSKTDVCGSPKLARGEPTQRRADLEFDALQHLDGLICRWNCDWPDVLIHGLIVTGGPEERGLHWSYREFLYR
jgi:hypothetical protein